MNEKIRKMKIANRYLNILSFIMWLGMFVLLCLDKVADLRFAYGASIVVLMLNLFSAIIQPIPPKAGE